MKKSGKLVRKLIIVLFAVFALSACAKSEEKQGNQITATPAGTKENSGSGETDGEIKNAGDGKSEATPTVAETTPEAVTETPQDKDKEAKEAFAKKLEEVYRPIKAEKIAAWLNLIEYTFKEKDSNLYNDWGAGQMVYINSGYNWDHYNNSRQFLYSYTDLDGDGVSELLTLINNPGIDWGWSDLAIYRYKDGKIESMNDGITCDYYNGETVPFKFYDGYNYIYTSEYGTENSTEILKLDNGIYTTLAYGEEYNPDAYRIVENGISKQSNKEKFDELAKKTLVNETTFKMEVYDIPANPVSEAEWSELINKVHAELRSKAIADGHIKSTSNNYIFADVDYDGLDEMIINDSDTLCVLDHCFYETDYRLVVEPTRFETIINYYPDQRSIEVYGQQINNYDEYTVHTETTGMDYYSFYHDYDKNVLSWESYEIWEKKENSDDSDYSISTYYYLNGEEIDGNTFREKRPEGKCIRIDSYAADGDASTEYLLAGSDSRYIDKYELYGFDAFLCKAARNEIYARHGRKFNSKDLQEYFSDKSWYNPYIDADKFDEASLNKYEIQNLATIKEYEKEMNYNQ